MLNFIVCEDDKKFQTELIEQIHQYMMKFNIDYNVYPLQDYGSDFERIAKEEIGFKVYLFDIKTENGTGIDATRYIRETIKDRISQIIIITNFNEYRYDALGNRLEVLDFISKVDDCKNRVEKALELSVEKYQTPQNSIIYKYNDMIRRIEFNKILYIEKEKGCKRCNIYTIDDEPVKIPMSLVEVEKKLDAKKFIQIHRGIIVNIEKIDTYDIKNSEIVFINGQTINTIAREKRKELVKKITIHS